MKDNKLTPLDRIGKDMIKTTQKELLKTDTENIGKALQTVGKIAVAAGALTVAVVEALGGGGKVTRKK